MDHRKLHDKLFRRSLSNIDIAKDFIISHMPQELLAKLNLNMVKFYRNFYINNDLIWVSGPFFKGSTAFDHSLKKRHN